MPLPQEILDFFRNLGLNPSGLEMNPLVAGLVQSWSNPFAPVNDDKPNSNTIKVALDTNRYTKSSNGMKQWPVLVEDALFQTAANTLKLARYVFSAPGAKKFYPLRIGLGLSNPRPAAVSSSAELRGYVWAGDQVAAAAAALDPILAKGVLAMVYSSQINDAAGKPIQISDGSAKQFTSGRGIEADPDGQFSITAGVIGVGCNAPNVVKFIVEGMLIGE